MCISCIVCEHLSLVWLHWIVIIVSRKKTVCVKKKCVCKRYVTKTVCVTWSRLGNFSFKTKPEIFFRFVIFYGVALLRPHTCEYSLWWNENHIRRHNEKSIGARGCHVKCTFFFHCPLHRSLLDLSHDNNNNMGSQVKPGPARCYIQTDTITYGTSGQRNKSVRDRKNPVFFSGT